MPLMVPACRRRAVVTQLMSRTSTVANGNLEHVCRVEFSELGYAGYSVDGATWCAQEASEYVRQVIPEPMSVQSPPVTTPVFLNHCQAYPG